MKKKRTRHPWNFGTMTDPQIANNLIYLGYYYTDQERREDPFRKRVLFCVKKNEDVSLGRNMGYMRKDDVIDDFSREFVCT